ncbi:MAG: hypothetical protein H6684_15255 [Deltaproteobacteria bacterium]|nr:hypothetical protein [Deltaproteobacteria bacterium]
MWILLGLVLVLFSGTAACGSGDDDDDTGAATSTDDDDTSDDDTADDDTSDDDTSDDDTADDDTADDDVELPLYGPSLADLDADCQPLGWGDECLYPYPSNVFIDDAGDGRTVMLPDRAIPAKNEGEPISPLGLFNADGFSHGAQIVTLVPADLDTEPLVGNYEDPDDSVSPDSPTLLIDTETGEAIPHIAEVMPLTADDNDQTQLLFLRPMVRLVNERRYVVALHDLHTTDESPIDFSETFDALVDGAAAENLEPLQDWYDLAIFPIVDDFGVAANDLQLAWDFTTESQASVAGDMLSMRTQALDDFAANGVKVKIKKILSRSDGDEIPNDDNEAIAYAVEGVLKNVPLFMDKDGPGARMIRDETGAPMFTERADVPFLMLIPTSITADDAGKVPVVQYGHGFFGTYLDGERMYPFLRDYKIIMVKTDWVGMTRPDAVSVGSTIVFNTEESFSFTDRLHQAMVNFMALTEATHQGIAVTIDDLGLDGEAPYDPDQFWFYGNSQGHILGGTYIALAPHIERAVLGVGGANWEMMMSRATPFQPLALVGRVALGGELNFQKFVSIAQSSLDRVDPLTYAPHVLSDTYPGSPSARRVLQHMALGDVSVPNMAGQLHSRALGLPQLGPVDGRTAIPLVDTVTAPVDGSAVMVFDFGLDPLPGREPGFEYTDPSVHELPRVQEVGQEQIDQFARTGVINAVCDGVCDPD